MPPFLGVQITVMRFCLAPFLFSPVFASVSVSSVFGVD